MGTTADKINYAINATNDIAEGINNIGGNITQNTELADFKDELDTIYNQMPKTPTQTGTSITLENTKKGRINIDLKGNTSQESTRGVNQFDHYNYPVNESKNGITITNNGDGSFTLNGTCTANNTIFEFAQVGKIKELGMNNNLVHTLYYISGTNSKSSASSSNRNVMRLNYDKPNSMIHLEELETQLIISKKQSLYTSATGWGVNIVVNPGDSFNNFKVKYQLEIGDEATDYEPYTGGIPSPSPSFPQQIKVVKGNNTITIGDETNSENYSVNLGTLELYKISDYQDYIYKSNDKWYKKALIGKVALKDLTFETGTNLYKVSNFKSLYNSETINSQRNNGLCSHFGIGYGTTFNDKEIVVISSGILEVKYSDMTTLEDFETFLSQNNPLFYYQLATATDTEITDTTLIEQLEELNRIIIPGGTITITTESNTNNAQLIISASALKE